MVRKHNATASPSFFSRSLVPPPSALQPFPPLDERTNHAYGKRIVTELRVLNAYAGIGGNRHLWPASWRVTGVELDPRVAGEYARRYPDDTVIVGDAHAYVMEHAHEFDAVWTSPPCPTHSRLAINVARRKGVEPAPDPRLWAEIRHLRALGIAYVVENVHTYYEPPILPELVTERHYYWMTNPPLMLAPFHSEFRLRASTTAAQYAEAYGLPPLTPGSVPDRRKAMRNAVVPLEGIQVAQAAFACVLQPIGLESGL
jgi:DNA (cytosine-5)-methyltransferase 1